MSWPKWWPRSCWLRFHRHDWLTDRQGTHVCRTCSAVIGGVQ